MPLLLPRQFSTAVFQFQATGLNNITFSATTHRIALLAPQAPWSGVLDKVAFYLGTVTTGCTVRVSIQTLSATTGEASGVLFAPGAQGTVAVANTDDNRWFTVDIGTPPTINAGDYYAVVLDYSSGAVPNFLMPDAAVGAQGSPNSANGRFGRFFNGASWAATTNQRTTLFPHFVDRGWFSTTGVSTLSNIGSVSVTSTSSPDEVGTLFSPPWDIGCYGAQAFTFGANAARAGEYRLYDSANNLLASRSVDSDVVTTTAANVTQSVIFVDPRTDLIPLRGGAEYRLTFLATTPTTTPFAIRQGTITATNIPADLLTSIANGWVFKGTQRTDLGAWTDSTTAINGVGPLIVGFGQTEHQTAYFG